MSKESINKLTKEEARIILNALSEQLDQLIKQGEEAEKLNREDFNYGLSITIGAMTEAYKNVKNWISEAIDIVEKQ